MRWSKLPLFVTLTVCSLALASLVRSAEDAPPPKLLGPSSAEQMREPPFAEWFVEGYDDYTPNPGVVSALNRIDRQGLDLSVFFGTWCGDSRREVPRLVKLFDTLGLPADQVRLIGVDSTEALHKRAPGGEERGLEIYRVPTLIVRRDGREIGRLVEHPQLSLERDLLAILDGTDYTPSYRSYPLLRRWLTTGLLADENVSPRGLSHELRPLVAGEGELAAAGRVLATRGDTREALTLFRINCELYADSSRAWANAADAWLAVGEREQARRAAERAVTLNRDAESVEALVDLLARTRE